MKATYRKFIDLHCDTLTECLGRKTGLDGDIMPHFGLSRLPENLHLCQCMAVFMPDEYRGKSAEDYFDSICEIYKRETKAHAAKLTKLTDASEISSALDSTQFASILTVEGGSAINGKLENLDKLYGCGVRMMTLTWNAENEIAGGASTDKGFTPFGRQVVAKMEQLGMAVDVSHLSDVGFWELCEFASKPFLASHSNARAICGHRRNLTDDMICEIINRGGLMGINYSIWFLRDGGENVTVDDILRHIYHVLELGGEDILALGSDYDGTDVPQDICRLDKIGTLIEALDKSGIQSSVVDKILFENASRYLSGLRR